MVQTIDVACIDDLTQTMATVADSTALAHAVARRLITPNGQASWWPSYGIDMREFLGSKTPRSAIAAAALIEIRKDERVSDAEVTVSTLTPTAIKLDVAVTTTDGAVLQWSLAVSEASVTVEGLQ